MSVHCVCLVCLSLLLCYLIKPRRHRALRVGGPLTSSMMMVIIIIIVEVICISIVIIVTVIVSVVVFVAMFKY